MFTARNLHKHSLKSLSDFVHSHSSKSVLLVREVSPQITGSNAAHSSKPKEDRLFSPHPPFYPFNSWYRSMSTSKGRSMRSKVENRMRKESGKTLREMRRAKKIQKKLMTENERLIFNLKRAKKKVSLLLQKLKKYELPELPQPRHDPEILTLEQLQAYKKIGFRNKNYVPVGVRGVFGGVVQNMHMHWKFHETVQVCCDNFPKEKIKEMATMLARLSGGIVINVHNVKTIIMFRGRNYRQPKNLIPINTLTKRKALFKARFEQALESQKLNIKKIEQELRRSGINPEDPAAAASIQRVASSFFNAIDKKEGSPYVFHGEKLSVAAPENNMITSELEPSDEREQEELDKFIADIEEAAEREWVAEETAEKEEVGRIRYWNREDFSGRFKRSGSPRDENSDDEIRVTRSWKETQGKQNAYHSNDSDTGQEWDSDDAGDVTANSDSDDSFETRHKFNTSKPDRGKLDKSWPRSNDGFRKNVAADDGKNMLKEDAESEDALSDLDNTMWQSSGSDEEKPCPRSSKAINDDYRSDSDEEVGNFHQVMGVEKKGSKQNSNRTGNSRKKLAGNDQRANDTSSDTENASWDLEADEDSKASRAERYNIWSSDGEEFQRKSDKKSGSEVKRTRTPKEMDENWESD